VKMDYDELLYTVNMPEIVETIKRLYARFTKKNLPLFGFPTKDLSQYLTTTRDARYEISWMPSWVFRMKTERVLEDNESGDDDEDDQGLFDEFVMIDNADM